MNAKLIFIRTLRALLVPLIVAFPMAAYSDQSESVTTIPGTDGDDTIIVTDSETAGSALGSSSGETSTSASTVVHGFGGNDIVTISTDVLADAEVITAILVDPAASRSSASSTGVNAGAGNDEIVSAGQNTISATAIGAYAADVVLDDDDISDGEDKVDVSVATDTAATGLDGGDGDDSVTSGATIVSDATAGSGGSGSSLLGSFGQSLAIDVGAIAAANATGIQMGAGADSVNNGGTITSTASANSLTLGVGVISMTSQDPASPVQANINAGAMAGSYAVGIDTDGAQTNANIDVSAATADGGLTISIESSVATVSGDDSITNNGSVTSMANADANSGAGFVTTSASGSTSVAANAEATAVGAALSSGGGSDAVDNQGALQAESVATSGALAITYTPGGTDSTGSADAASSSNATATGIAADGLAVDRQTTLSTRLTNNSVTIERSDAQQAQRGDDIVTNRSTIDATADARSGIIAAATIVDGAASTTVTSNAAASASAIDAGAGSDDVDNDADLNSTASAAATSLNLSYGQAGTTAMDSSATVSAGSTAVADAAGIRGDSGNDTNATSTLTLGSAGVSVVSTGSSTALASNDVIVSNGALVVVSDAQSLAGGGSIAVDGAANAESNSSAAAGAAAIAAGGGDDQVTSIGVMTVTAESSAVGIAIGIGLASMGAEPAETRVEAKTEANADAVGVATDSGNDIESSRSLVVDASGISYDESTAITADSGNDTLDNSAAVGVTAIAETFAAATTVSIGGSAQAELQAAASASAFGLNTGGGTDVLTNAGAVTTNASATAATLNASFTTEGSATTNTGLFGAGTSANARSVGISSAGAKHLTLSTIAASIDFDNPGVSGRYVSVVDDISGDSADTIDNTGAVIATSSATTVQLNGAGSSRGTALTLGRTEVNAQTGGIESGNGDDVVNNGGALTTSSTADAIMVNLAVTADTGSAGAGNSAWDGGTVANASSTGIDADSGSMTTTLVNVEANADRAQVIYDETTIAASGDDVITNTGTIDSSAAATAATVSAAVAINGVAAGVSTSSAEADSTGIRGGEGDDFIDNEGAITSMADAGAYTANVTFASQGLAVAVDAVWDSGTSANATATGIAGDGGNSSETTRLAIGTDEMGITRSNATASGADTIINSATVTAAAKSETFSLGAAVAGSGASVAVATSTATSNATAIDAGAGSEVDDVTNSGELTAIATATAATATVSAVYTGVALGADSVWDGGTTADARARGIDVGSGGEVIDNSGDIAATADATAVSAVVAASVQGFAGATGTATGNADAIAIDASAGDDDDTVRSSGDLTVIANSDAMGITATFTGAGVSASVGAVWDGGTEANSSSRGIAVGAGADVVETSGSITSTADAESTDVVAAVSINGVAGAVSTATTNADAIAVDSGDGDDRIDNTGNLTVTSRSDALTVGVVATGVGLAGASDAVWDGGTTANSSATGLQAGGGNDVVTSGAGVSNSTMATAGTESVQVSIAGYGVALSLTAATANSNANAIEAGDGDDTVTNASDITSTANSTANGVSVSLTAQGLAAAGGSPLLDNATTANASATGINGGSGGDTINNAADTIMDVDSTATTGSTAVALTLVGISGAGLDANANAEAAGIDGGDDDDSLTNAGEINGLATSTAAARAVSFGAFAGLVGFDSVAQSDVYGLFGGAGNDTINNTGVVGVLSNASATGQGIAASVLGVSLTSATADSIANSTGLSGGAGNDSVDNSGTINVDAQATTTMRTIAATLAGGSIANADTTANVTATAVGGGAGADTLTNTGSIRVGPAEDAVGADLWMAEIVATNFVGTGIGAAISEQESTAAATSVGMDGGAGNDTVLNEGDIDVTASARSTLTDSRLVLVGAANSSSESGATTLATGLGGGAGDDTIESSGTVSVSSESLLIQRGGDAQFTLVGGNNSDSGLLATTTAVGVGGDAGADRIDTSGSISVDALSTLDTSGSDGITIIGSASVAGSSGARTSAIGIDGGDDDDVINSAASLDVDAKSGLTIDNSSYSFIGGSGSGANLTATTSADGIVGGAGADQIVNTGDITVDIISDLNSRGGSDTTFGGSSTESVSGASANVRGISGGEDDDIIENSGNVTINARSKIRTNAVSYTFLGSGGTDVAMTGESTATGMHGDAGNNTITNRGVLDVTASADLIATGGSKTTISGGNASSGRSEATTSATGLAANDGNDTLETTGTLHVRSSAEPEARNTANTSASLISNTGASSSTTSVADAVGLAAGAGDNTMFAAGTVTVRSDANAYSIAYANGANLSLAGNATTTVTSNVVATATGFSGGDGDDIVVNDADVNVTADSDTSKTVTITAPVRTFDPVETEPALVEPIPYDVDVIPDMTLPPLADGGEFSDGEYVFWTETAVDPDNPQDPPPRNDPNVLSDGAYYQAVRTESTDGDGNVVVSWTWVPAPVNIIDRAEQYPGLASSAAAVAQGVGGVGRSTATGTSTAKAWGVDLGDGDNTVTNNGSLTVLADANATVRSSAAGGSTGDAYATTNATASAEAFGVLFGDGDNVLVNSGSIDVEASAIASAVADADAGGGVCITFLWWEWCIAPGRAFPSSNPSRNASAYGVATGDGNNTIVNEVGADIMVRAVAANGSLMAVGIQTGSGDDIVINNGLISATIVRGGIVTAGTGIDLGDGNDQLTLGDGSEVVGTVILGNGDDTLTLVGAPIVHDGSGNPYNLPGGDGIDTLILEGPGFYAALPIDFEHAIKTGEGTYTLPSLATLDSLTIDGGALQLDSDYVFSTNGAYATYFDTESAGSLVVNGNTALNGSVSIERRDNDFMADGTRFSLITASGGISGAFASTTIPEARPLLSYSVEQQANTYDIVANASSFATVASNPLHTEIANNLYRIAPQASGDLAQLLGGVQQLEAGFDRAFAGFSPDSHQALTTSAVAMGLQTVQMLQSHLGNARAVERGKAPLSFAYEPVTLSYMSGQLQANRVQPTFSNSAANAGTALGWQSGRTWVAGFRADGEYEASAGHSEIDNNASGFAVGVDYAIGSGSILGFNIGYSDVDVDSLEALASSSIESWTGGVYLTVFSDRSYIEGGFSLTGHDILNVRQLQIGDDVRSINSKHDGRTRMAYLGAGHEFGARAWRLEPYASLYYFNTSEDAYQEFGGGGANQVFTGDSTVNFFGEFGVRVFRLQETPKGVINWHAFLAMAHDFDSQDSDISYAYEGLPSEIFTTRNRNLSSGSVAYGLGVAYSRGGSTLSLDYRNQENSDFRNKIFSARLALAF